MFVALVLSGVHRIGTATVAYMLDGAAPVALGGVAEPLAGAMIAKGTFAGAARHAADAFRGDDEKTNVLRRTIIPLVLSALKEAYDSSRAETPAVKREYSALMPVPAAVSVPASSCPRSLETDGGVGARRRHDLGLVEARANLIRLRAEVEVRVVEDEVLDHRQVLASSATPRPKPTPTPPGLPVHELALDVAGLVPDAPRRGLRRGLVLLGAERQRRRNAA